MRETDAARLRQALAALKAQLEETVRQTNQMLVLARADTAELPFERIDLGALAAELTRGWWAEARERGIELDLDTAEDRVHSVQGHAGLLKEALSNLLHNALRYTPSGGHVTVRITAAAGQVRLATVDDGPGLPEDELQRAGERFFRGRNTTASGSGIGLAIVRSIAERHGGRLEVGRGSDGRGFEATIVLPQRDARSDPAG
jgi:two-component system sensor histidine kinase TctE